jgi:Mg-chelatase subunit ChlD
MSAALPSLVGAFLVVLQMSSARCVAAEEEPKVIVKDLTSAA